MDFSTRNGKTAHLFVRAHSATPHQLMTPRWYAFPVSCLTWLTTTYSVLSLRYIIILPMYTTALHDLATDWYIEIWGLIQCIKVFKVRTFSVTDVTFNFAILARTIHLQKHFFCKIKKCSPAKREGWKCERKNWLKIGKCYNFFSKSFISTLVYFGLLPCSTTKNGKLAREKAIFSLKNSRASRDI